MLVISRREQDELVLEMGGEKVTIKVTQVGNGQVRLGFSAPDSCKIWRQELFSTVLANRQASQPPTGSMKEIAKLLRLRREEAKG